MLRQQNELLKRQLDVMDGDDDSDVGVVESDQQDLSEHKARVRAANIF